MQEIESETYCSSFRRTLKHDSLPEKDILGSVCLVGSMMDMGGSTQTPYSIRKNTAVSEIERFTAGSNVLDDLTTTK